jgi:hypothetical protein
MFRGRNKLVVNVTAIALIAMAACFLHSNNAFAAINQDLSFEGKIVTNAGLNITDGNYNAEFTIYTGCTNNTGTGCTAVWKEDYLTGTGTYPSTVPVAFTSGTFQVNLGSLCPFTTGSCEGNSNTAINWDTSPLYLSINLGTNATGCNTWSSCSGTVMSPYILLTASPYAMDAANADSLGGIAASSFAQLSVNNTWTGTDLIHTTSATALQVGSTGSTTVLGVDTSGNQVLLGSNSNVNGKLVINSSGATGYVGLTVSTTAFTGYNLTLPNAAPTAASQCLQSSSGTFTNLSWGSCGGGGSSTTNVTLEPEFAGAVFSASSGSGANLGYMQSDHVSGLVSGQGYEHNFYSWNTDQSTAQDYDIITEYQLPTGFNSFVSNSWKSWVYETTTGTNYSVKINITDVSQSDTDCYTGGFQSISPTTGGSWQQTSLPAFNACTSSFAAGDILKIDIRLTSVSPTTNLVDLGELTFQYQ